MENNRISKAQALKLLKDGPSLDSFWPDDWSDEMLDDFGIVKKRLFPDLYEQNEE